MELSVCDSTPAGSSLRGQYASCINPECCSEKRELKAKCFQQEQKLIQIERDNAVRAPITCMSRAELSSTFRGIFTTNELDKLRQIEPTRTGDSSFILHAVRCLYKDDLKKLSQISLSGRSNKGQKEQIAYAQYNVIEKLFRKRLKALRLSAEEYIDREKQMNKHIKNAFNNLARSKQATDV